MVAQRTAQRWRLGREIAQLMAETGIKQKQAAELIESRQERIADLLNGEAAISAGDLRQLVTGLGVTDEDFLQELLALRRDTPKRGFWSTGHNRAYDEGFRFMVDLEQHADLLRYVASEVVPGILQCESYVRLLFEGKIREGEITTEDYIQARRARHTVLLKQDAPEYRAVLSQSCLERDYGSAKVMREQIGHLIELSQRPNVLLQVMPFKVKPGTFSMSSPFVLVRLPPVTHGLAGALELAYIQGEGEVRYLDHSDTLKAYDAAWARLSSGALTPQETREFMHYTAHNHQ